MLMQTYIMIKETYCMCSYRAVKLLKPAMKVIKCVFERRASDNMVDDMQFNSGMAPSAKSC